jgi:hypothetical protein
VCGALNRRNVIILRSSFGSDEFKAIVRKKPLLLMRVLQVVVVVVVVVMMMMTMTMTMMILMMMVMMMMR